MDVRSIRQQKLVSNEAAWRGTRFVCCAQEKKKASSGGAGTCGGRNGPGFPVHRSQYDSPPPRFKLTISNFPRQRNTNPTIIASHPRPCQPQTRQQTPSHPFCHSPLVIIGTAKMIRIFGIAFLSYSTSKTSKSDTTGTRNPWAPRERDEGL